MKTNNHINDSHVFSLEEWICILALSNIQNPELAIFKNLNFCLLLLMFYFAEFDCSIYLKILLVCSQILQSYSFIQMLNQNSSDGPSNPIICSSSPLPFLEFSIYLLWSLLLHLKIIKFHISSSFWNPDLEEISDLQNLEMTFCRSPKYVSITR